MASPSRPLPTAVQPTVTPFPMTSLSRLRFAPGYARFATSLSSSSSSSCTRFSKAVVPSAARARVSPSTDSAALNDSWLASLSCPLPRKDELGLDSGEGEGVVGSGSGDSGPEWIIGVDPDVSGALALLRPDGSTSGYSAQVFDSPFVKVMVGKTFRKRLDPRSMVQLLRSFNAPIGTTAYIEQSAPFPQDGKQDDSRRVASDMFPSLASELKRKKDHGRAEALLIAAYGRSITQQSNQNYSLTEAKEMQLQLC